MEAEIQDAKQMVLDLKRELRLRAAAGDSLEGEALDKDELRGVKRVKGGDEVVTISGGAGKDRVVRRSKRAERSGVAQAASRVFFGAIIFGLGVGAAQ